MVQLGTTIKDKRKRKGWSQTILGDLVGMSAATIHRIEHGERIPIDDELKLFSDTLDLELSKLIDFATEDRLSNKNTIVPATSYQTHWEYAHPAEYAGRVWIQIYPQAKSLSDGIHIQAQWGDWQYQSILDISNHKSIVLSHYKFNDGQGLPLIFQLSQPCYVVFGKETPPDIHTIDIINQWHRIHPLSLPQTLRFIINFVVTFTTWHIKNIFKRKS